MRFRMVLQGVISRASFRRQPRGGKSFFTVLSLQINKCGIGKKLLLSVRAVMIEEHVDLVVGDFNGAAWRRQIGNGNLSTIEQAFAGSDLPMPPDPPPLWRPGAVPGDWADVCGFSQASRLYGRWKVRQHGAFSIHHDSQGLRPKDQSCHHEVWLHLAFVKTITVTTNREKGMSNGFSSRKDLLLSSPARKEAKQVRTKATVRFRPERQATVRCRHNRPYVQHGSHEHNSRCTRSRFTKALVL